MKITEMFGVGGAILLCSTFALAADPPAPGVSGPVADRPSAETPENPPQRRGFESAAVLGLEGPASGLGSVVGLGATTQLELGVRLSPRFRLSLNLGAGVGAPGSKVDGLCDAARAAAPEDEETDKPNGSSTGCVHATVGGSAHLRYDFNDTESGISPFVSLGSGYERIWVAAGTGESEQSLGYYSATVDLINWAIPRVGLEFTIDDRRLGIFAMTKIGTYRLQESQTIHVGEALPETPDRGLAVFAGGGFLLLL